MIQHKYFRKTVLSIWFGGWKKNEKVAAVTVQSRNDESLNWGTGGQINGQKQICKQSQCIECQDSVTPCPYQPSETALACFVLFCFLRDGEPKKIRFFFF